MNPQQYDELTGLEKRESILGKIKTLISEKEKFHIIFADIDFFKSINDNFGHKRGDEIIKGIADFLKEIVGNEGRISRWGGDEFLILLSQNPQIFTEKIGELLLSKKFKGEPELSISLSFGIASYPDDGKNFEELYDAADKRMYDFKKRRRWKGRIVDRKEELSRIREYIVRVMKGDSLFLNIYGEKGCGKTRIIQESSIYAQIVGFDVRIIDGKKKNEFFKFLEGDTFFDVKERFYIKIKEIADRKPLFFSIDDIHFFPEIIDFIIYIVKKNKNVFFITSSLNPFEDCENMKISNLDIYGTSELVEGMLGMRNIKSDFINSIYRETLGNPHKIINIINHISKKGNIETIYNEYNFKEGMIKDVENNFDDDEKTILMLKKVLNENFNEELAAKITNKKIDYVVSVIEKSERLGVSDLEYFEEIGSKYYEKIAEYFSIIGNKKTAGDFYLKTSNFEKAHIEYLKYLEENLGRFLKKEYEGILEILKKWENEKWFRKKDYFLRYADYHYKLGEFEKAIYYLDLALNIENDEEVLLKKAKTLAKIGDMKKSYEILNIIGDKGLPFISELFIKIGDYERAFLNAKKGIERLKEPEELMESYTALGGAYIKMREFDKGIKSLEMALSIARHLDNKHWISIINNRIGAIFFLKSDWTTAKIYYERALNGFKESGDVFSMGNVMLNLGLVYEREGEIKEAMNYYKKALDISKDISSIYIEGEAYGNIGRLFLIKEDYEKAEDFILKGIEIMRKMKSLESLFYLYSDLIKIYINKGKISSSERYIKKSKKIAESLKSEILKKRVLLHEANYHILNGNPKTGIKILQGLKETRFEELKGDIFLLLSLGMDILGNTRDARFYGMKGLKFYKENGSILEISSCYDKLSRMKAFEKERENFINIRDDLKRRLRVYEI